MVFPQRIALPTGLSATRTGRQLDWIMTPTRFNFASGWQDQEGLLKALLPAVLAAGRVEKGYFRSGVAVVTKADTTPVTRADQEAEALLMAHLARVAPAVPVVAEEAMAAGQKPGALGRAFFLVDPLDGTREFINGRPEFTINVALVIDGQPLFGVIYAPVTGAFYATIGAQRAISGRFDPETSESEAWAAIKAGTTLAARRPPLDGLIAVASYSHMNDATRRYLATFPVKETRQAGSSLKFCLVAAGEADIYPRVGPTAEWDIAAGHAILAAAGGSLTALDGTAIQYGKLQQGFKNPDYVARGLLK
jgi:3'(2'), 5'-bisphosphate nucleotidase